MKIGGIDFPKPLLNVARNGELIVFAGAGVSMGEPACLPNFEKLAEEIAKGTGNPIEEPETIDKFLGRLKSDEVKVHDRAAEILSISNPKATELHQNLLRLYTEVKQVRIVTTNFDLLFETAARDIFDSQPEVFRAPALPLGDRFNGIVHVHGAVSHPNGMVLTDKDFGCAYLTEGWARRFLVGLFGKCTVLFVGYSHGDVMLNYLARALPDRESDQRFTLIGDKGDDADRWRKLGIEPIVYSQSDTSDHSGLYSGVGKLANFIRRGFIDWNREITEIAKGSPPFDEETADLMDDALGDATKTGFFTQSAKDPAWIDWLDTRNHLNALFGDGKLVERDEILCRWLANFVHTHDDKLFLLITKHNTCLHQYFWYLLAQAVMYDKEIARDILSRWISLLLATLQTSKNGYSWDYLVSKMGMHCINHEMMDSLLQIFDAMTSIHVSLTKNIFHMIDSSFPAVNVKLSTVGNHSLSRKLWEDGLKPRLSQVAERLFRLVIGRLEKRYFILHAWQQVDRDWDDDDLVDSLIDVARDCLEWLVVHRVEVAAQWCDQFARSDAPLLRRLAIHGISERKDMTANEKIDWIFKNIGLHEFSTSHEVFRAIKQSYPESDRQHRTRIIESVWAFHYPNKENPETERYTAYYHFEWFYWLHESDPNCPLAKQAWEKVSQEHPKFKPREDPDRLMLRSEPRTLAQQKSPKSPWTPEELLDKPAAELLDSLLSSLDIGDFPSREGINDSVTKAARQNIDWGLELAGALAKKGAWIADLWSALIRSWSKMDLSEDEYRKVLHWLARIELYPNNAREIADVLYNLARGSDTPYTLKLLPLANKIASALWQYLETPESIKRREQRRFGPINDWRQTAINSPEGWLAEFWVLGIWLWRSQQSPKPTALSDEYRVALSNITGNNDLPGRLGKTMLTSEFPFLLDVDESWTQENLLPLFVSNNDDFQAAWDGFSYSGQLNLTVAEAMADQFLKAVPQIDKFSSETRHQFIERYITMLIYYVEDPLDKWIPELFKHIDQETRHDFARCIERRLGEMNESQRQELWNRWLKRYWKDRTDGVNKPLDSGEIETMLNWLPHLKPVFNEAVEVAIKMPHETLQHYGMVYTLDESDLPQLYPKDTAKLLIYLWKPDLPQHDIQNQPFAHLIDRLLQLEISSQSRQKLEEMNAQI